MTAADPVTVVGGPHDGAGVEPRLLEGRGAWVWFDGQAIYDAPGTGRTLYWIVDAAGGPHLAFGGHGSQVCGNCHATLSPDEGGSRLPKCPLCGAGQRAGKAG